MTAVDVHQHLWPEEVLRVLESRATAPLALWRNGRWQVRPAAEPSFTIDPADHDPEERALALPGAGVDRALLCLSSPVGIEALPGPAALAGTTAWREAVATLPAALGWWAAMPLRFPPSEQAQIVHEALAAGAVGLCLPAGVLSSPSSAEVSLPLLGALAAAGAPLFVHPGPATGGPQDPDWWSPTTSYVAQLHAAWFAFHAVVRPALANLRVIFALLAGLAPLHAERAARRGAPDLQRTALEDPLCFYDTSSYGPRAVRALVGVVGTGPLVHGTDYPVVSPAGDPVAQALGQPTADLVRRDGAARALGYAWAPA